ncbi:MAG: hypothetical protein ABIS69_04810 [Sediminibacterium sp.]
MKKLLLTLIIVLFVFSVFIYFFIPTNIVMVSSIVVKAPDIVAERFITTESKWSNWWNYTDTNTVLHQKLPVNGFRKNDVAFKLINPLYKSADIQITHSGETLKGKLVIIGLAVDSTGIELKTSLHTGYNPYKRITGYFSARLIKKNIDAVLKDLKSFLTKPENVYGIGIERVSIKDTQFVSTKKIIKAVPGNSEIYQLIGQLKNYAASKGAIQTGSPIYNVTDLQDGTNRLMVGIPINKSVPENDLFSIKRMIKGSFMITEVVGGDSAVEKASKNLLLYFKDYRKTSMAINFNMLITDRMMQPDSTKWITRLYQPVY